MYPKYRTAGTLVAVVLFVLVAFNSASADLAGVSRQNVQTGFPFWYQDLATGTVGATRLGLCLDTRFCLTTRAIAGNLQSEATGFGRSAYYWQAEADITNGAAKIVEYKAGLQATYAGAVADGNQIVNNFVIISLKNVPAGTYTVVHPFGRQVLTIPAGQKDIDFTMTIGGANRSLALNGPVGPFLQAVDPAPPVGFIGVRDVLQTVTGSPRRTNFLRLIAPANVDIGGPATSPNIVTQRLFRLQGQMMPVR